MVQTLFERLEPLSEPLIDTDLMDDDWKQIHAPAAIWNLGFILEGVYIDKR